MGPPRGGEGALRALPTNGDAAPPAPPAGGALAGRHATTHPLPQQGDKRVGIAQDDDAAPPLPQQEGHSQAATLLRPRY